MRTARARDAWRATAKFALPPPRLNLSEWASENYVLSPDASALPGKFNAYPYQCGIMDAITDPRVSQVFWMSSARVGKTSVMNAAIGYWIHRDPGPVMVVEPTIEEAEAWSKDQLQPMLRDCPVLRDAVKKPKSRDADSSIRRKVFPGGSIRILGSNAPSGFRAKTIRYLVMDEIDGWDATAGAEGDQIKLARRRTETFFNRKILGCSTPLTAGDSRIEKLYQAGDMRRYYVPCPHCGRMDVLVFQKDDESTGHHMTWPEGNPSGAYFVCSGCAQGIEHRHKEDIVKAGEWRASRPFADTLDVHGKGTASFFLWSAYSFSANAHWGQIATEYVEAEKHGPEQLKTFWNTMLGRTWTARGDAPEWRRLWDRREKWATGTVPAGVEFLTAGVDVQGDRVIYNVVGWSRRKENWSLEIGEIHGKTADEGGAVWRKLDEVLATQWKNAAGDVFTIRLMAIDTGWVTHTVYSWVRRHSPGPVMAIKGDGAEGAPILSHAGEKDVSVGGNTIPGGVTLWKVGVSTAKEELYGWLRLDKPTEPGQPFPPGYCHFPEHDDSFFRQLTSEQLVETRKRSGHMVRAWQLLPGRENHHLDAMVYARAAAYRLQMDMAAAWDAKAAAAPARVQQASPKNPDSVPGMASGWLASARGRGPWISKRR